MRTLGTTTSRVLRITGFGDRFESKTTNFFWARPPLPNAFHSHHNIIIILVLYYTLSCVFSCDGQPRFDDHNVVRIRTMVRLIGWCTRSASHQCCAFRVCRLLGRQTRYVLGREKNPRTSSSSIKSIQLLRVHIPQTAFTRGVFVKKKKKLVHQHSHGGVRKQRFFFFKYPSVVHQTQQPLLSTEIIDLDVTIDIVFRLNA